MKSEGKKISRTNWRYYARTLHRDFGYVFASLIIIYSLSGIALNHIKDWNPDFSIERKDISLPDKVNRKEDVTEKTVLHWAELVGEKHYLTYDFPTDNQIKIYFDNASMLINLGEKSANYEKLSRRMIFYESNLLHRNVLAWWKWISDIFALSLILITILGIFILRGEQGIFGRGGWLLITGITVPVIGIAIYYISS